MKTIDADTILARATPAAHQQDTRFPCRSPACCTPMKSSSRKHERWRGSQRRTATTAPTI